jgi:hypothetical protein
MGALKRLSRKFTRLIRGPQTLDQKHAEWRSVHQPFELRFHQQRNYRWDESVFSWQWNEVYGQLMGLKPDHFRQSQTLLDIGCGSRPCLDWFHSGRKCFVDPLLGDYCRIEAMSGYWRDKPKECLYSLPAEEFIAPLEGECDFVNCWNVLDHTYDWRAILENIRCYTKSGSLVCLGTDFEEGGEGHPGIDDPGYFWHFINSHFEIAAERRDFVYREVALKLVRK